MIKRKRGDKGKSEVVERGGKCRTLRGLVLGRSRDLSPFVTGERKAERVGRFEGRR